MKSIQHGVLLRKLNYSETSLILNFFTLENGFQAYIFQGGKKKKGNMLQALSLVEITAYRREDSELGKITEINSLYNPQSIPYHPIKSGLAFFITEVLAQVLKSSDQDESMFAFLEHEIKWLDNSEEYTNYPLWFLLKLANQIGIGIHVADPNGAIFDLQDGVIANQTPSSHLFVNDETVALLIELLNSDKNEFLALSIHRLLRSQITDHLIDYFKLHINGFKTPKSMAVMQTIFE
ncbi:DNA repair protein RecO [Brumimicrobium aurantiacum]|uniref:DNA repair protein RecO n=1 Tax=Brumimicrobium aurantiacum TaxID=1737063 RepID=A0A3E1EX38_9FLAO|nr:DNA repair protein RecO [Brumimicrobium aurantiacum]RFC54124.1 DNA repair protein RecO [Brumimicrobium aurantiacum]